MAKKKKTEVQRLRERIKALKVDLELEREKRSESESDRDRFRKFFVRELRAQITVQGEGKYYAPKSMIEKYSQFLGEVKSWFWA